jgi:hypothetical protein
MSTKERRAIHAYVSDTAHDQWHNFATHHGVTVSAILEALGPTLDQATDTPYDPNHPCNTIIAEARRIDTKRRRR